MSVEDDTSDAAPPYLAAEVTDDVGMLVLKSISIA